MSIRCHECRHFGVGFEPHAPNDIRFVQKFRLGHESAPRSSVIADGAQGSFLFTLYSGFAVRLGRGPGNQVRASAIILPGALVGLPSLFRPLPDVQVVAATDVTFCRFDPARWSELVQVPSLAERVLRISGLQALAADRLANAVRGLPAVGRLAYLFWDLHLALTRRRLASDGSFKLPVMRRHLADILGLTPMHFRRSCAALDTLGIATFDRERVHIHDTERLQKVAGHYRPSDEVAWLL